MKLEHRTFWPSTQGMSYRSWERVDEKQQRHSGAFAYFRNKMGTNPGCLLTFTHTDGSGHEYRVVQELTPMQKLEQIKELVNSPEAALDKVRSILNS